MMLKVLGELKALLSQNKLIAVLVLCIVFIAMISAGYLSVRQTRNALNDLHERCDSQFGEGEYVTYSCPCKSSTFGKCFCCLSNEEARRYSQQFNVNDLNVSIP